MPSRNPQNNNLTIVVGSQNPVKIAAVKHAFIRAFPNKTIEITGVSVKSGVSDQPMSDTESIKGGTTRALYAMEQVPADFAVGLEGGMQEIDGQWFTSGWCIIIDQNGQKGIGTSIRMLVPEKMVHLIKEGLELGKVNDVVFKTQNSKHANGMFGLMTNDAITRQSCYEDGVISALGRFIHPELF